MQVNAAESDRRITPNSVLPLVRELKAGMLDCMCWAQNTEPNFTYTPIRYNWKFLNTQPC